MTTRTGDYLGFPPISPTGVHILSDTPILPARSQAASKSKYRHLPGFAILLHWSLSEQPLWHRRIGSPPALVIPETPSVVSRGRFGTQVSKQFAIGHVERPAAVILAPSKWSSHTVERVHTGIVVLITEEAVRFLPNSAPPVLSPLNDGYQANRIGCRQ